MSAGAALILPGGLQENHSPDCLAPLFRESVLTAIEVCHAQGLDARLWETCRSAKLQELYWHRGRPPTPAFPGPVTWQRDARKSWHFYGLAVDVVSISQGWFVVTPAMLNGMSGAQAVTFRAAVARHRDDWYHAVADIFLAHGCAWGGHWTKPDTPHFQWGRCRPTPSQLSLDAVTIGGVQAVWKLVGAAAA